jgi:hypothetical protein
MRFAVSADTALSRFAHKEVRFFNPLYEFRLDDEGAL